MNHVEVRSSHSYLRRGHEDIAEGEDIIRLTVQGREEFASHKRKERYNLGLKKIVDQPSWA